MIPRTGPICQKETLQSTPSLDKWQTSLANAIRTPAELFEFLELPVTRLPDTAAAHQQFALRVPLDYAKRIKKGDLSDPLLKQVLPVAEEIDSPSAEFTRDPVGDQAAVIVPGLLHKYQGRVLLITTPACAVHCRYCFRRHYPYSDNHPDQNWLEAMEYIRDNPDIEEVILSGGDPLSLSETRLQKITDGLKKIPHINRLRIHTRQPIVLPERINPAFLAWLNALPWQIIMVIHCNHANELSVSVTQSIQQLHLAGITLLNQSVLLKGVNDELETLCHLSNKLFENNILPYYLHMLDKVEGAAHFQVSHGKALSLMSGMRNSLPGYLVPRLVEEIADFPAKQPVI